MAEAFNVVEASFEDIQAAFQAGRLTARQLVQSYLDRIAAFDKQGPAINAVIALNPDALADADRLDAAFKSGGPVGPLHGIPLLIKDQADVKGMATTMGSVLFKDYRPNRDGFVVSKLKQAGAIVIGKATLGELGGGDTHGSFSGRRATSTISSGRPAARRAAAARPYRPIFAPPRSGRRGSRRSAALRSGTASSACGRRSDW